MKASVDLDNIVKPCIIKEYNNRKKHKSYSENKEKKR